MLQSRASFYMAEVSWTPLDSHAQENPSEHVDAPLALLASLELRVEVLLK